MVVTAREFGELLAKAKQRDPEALYKLGICYLNGGPDYAQVTRDQRKAAEYFENAADLGHKQAPMQLIEIYYNDSETQPRLHYWEQQLTGKLNQQRELLGYYRSRNSPRMAALYELLVSKNKLSSLELAEYYRSGSEGVAKNPQRMLYWYEQAAEQGDKSLQLKLVELYRDGGEGTAKNPQRMLYWSEKLADAGDVACQLKVAEIYRDGAPGVGKNNVKMVHYLNLAAELNDKEAYYQLGECYRHGLGVPRDYAKACEYYTQAATLDHTALVVFREEVKFEQEYVDKERSRAARCVNPLVRVYLCGKKPSTTDREYVRPCSDSICLCEDGDDGDKADGFTRCWFGTILCPLVPFYVWLMYDHVSWKTYPSHTMNSIEKMVTTRRELDFPPPVDSLTASPIGARRYLHEQPTMEQRVLPDSPVITRQPSPVLQEFPGSQPARLAMSMRSLSMSRSITLPPPRSESNEMGGSGVPSALRSPSSQASLLSLQHITPKELVYNTADQSSVLGRGGFGVVYRGTWQEIDVAIKQLQMQLSKDMKTEFEREAQLHSSLRHPNIVLLYGVVFEPPQCMVMELMQGSVRDWLEDRRNILPWSERLRVAEEIAKGLNYLHSRTILHRDLKAANVLMDRQRTAKLSDFGLAKIKGEAAAQTYVDTGKGTLAWMAPELFQQQPNSIGSDIYAYGMTLWEIASRQIPFRDAQHAQLIIAWVGERNIRETVPTDSPSVIREIIGDARHGCWAVEPRNRPTLASILQKLRLHTKTEHDREPSVSEVLHSSLSGITLSGLDASMGFADNLVSRS